MDDNSLRSKFICYIMVMTGYAVLGFILGVGVGYLLFYFRYKHKDVVNELRSNLKEANKEVRGLGQDLEEYTQQNEILKVKMSEFLNKNDDLSKVVWELSKYYYHIKKASEKTDELAKFLQQPDTLIEEKMQAYIIEPHKDLSSGESDDMKKFF